MLRPGHPRIRITLHCGITGQANTPRLTAKAGREIENCYPTEGRGEGIRLDTITCTISASTPVDAICLPNSVIFHYHPWNMKLGMTIFGLIFIWAMMSCSATDQNTLSVNDPASSGKNEVAREYTSVEIGMSYAQFDRLCLPEDHPLGKMGRKDEFRQVESASGKTVYVHLVDDLKQQGTFRSQRGCAGTFRFHNHVLESRVSPHY